MGIMWQPEELEWKGRSCSLELLWDKFRTIDAIVLCLWLRHHSEGRGEEEAGEQGEVGCRNISFLPDI